MVKKKKALKKGAVGRKKTARGGAGKRKQNAAFMRPMTPDAALAEVVGFKAMPRTVITKKLWAYIKRHKLQDAKNRRMINADASLKAVFGGKKAVNMFEMTKLVNSHLSDSAKARSAKARAGPPKPSHGGGGGR